MPEQVKAQPHSVNIQSRQKLCAAGVSKIKFFSPETVAAETVDGVLIVKGEELFVESLDSQTGELLVKGKINGISYAESKDGKSFLKRIIK